MWKEGFGDILFTDPYITESMLEDEAKKKSDYQRIVKSGESFIIG